MKEDEHRILWNIQEYPSFRKGISKINWLVNTLPLYYGIYIARILDRERVGAIGNNLGNTGELCLR